MTVSTIHLASATHPARARQTRPLAVRLRWLRLLAAAWAPALLGLGMGLGVGPCAQAAPLAVPRDRVTLLVPDGADPKSWQVQVWTDTAAEEGLRIELLTDSALLALGSTAAAKIAGLIVPDSAHLRASDAVIAAIKQYAYTGGNLMLVYDAGALTAAGAFPLTGSSRFGDMVGLDYILWNNGQGAGTMVGFGPVVGTQARLDSLSFPPGKYLPYSPPVSLATTTNTTAFVAASAQDPGAAQAMAPLVTARAAQQAAAPSPAAGSLRALLGLGNDSTGPLRFGRRNPNATPARNMHMFDRVARKPDAVAAVLSTAAAPAAAAPLALAAPLAATPAVTAVEVSALAPAAAVALAAADTTLQTISGYVYGPLGYYSYVTTGTFPGTVYLSSPEHGLVAGLRPYGSGQLLFVNLPLGYFKAIGSDSAPLHGFLGLFARDQLGLASMSVQPRAKGGLVYNWHVDNGAHLNVYAKSLLANTTIFQHGPFSIHFTAGPDVITVGDKQGMNLPGNANSQALVKRLANIGSIPAGTGTGKLAAHELGSHGGWIHDFWGANATEANVPDLTNLLVQNFNAIEAVTGRKIREYSSPQGNTPLWAIKWLEARGVVVTYLVGDVGNGLVRSWRNGARVSTNLWTSPVTPLGQYATFEEFDEFGITDAVSGQWLIDLQSFAINHRTNRMFYNHPPGAAGHLAPINALLARGDTLAAQGSFSWYTMVQLADFAQRRVAATWSATVAGTTTTFSASHPTSLADMAWLLPKTSFAQPKVTSGVAAVTSDATNWIVTATSGVALKFTATAL